MWWELYCSIPFPLRYLFGWYLFLSSRDRCVWSCSNHLSITTKETNQSNFLHHLQYVRQKKKKKRKKLDFYRTAALYKYIWILNFHLEWCTTGPGWTKPQSVKSSFKTKIHQIVHCNYYNDCAISSALCNLSSTLKVIKSSARFNNTRHCSHSSLLTQVSDRLHSSENPVPETVCFLHPSTLEFQRNKNYDITVLTPRFSVWVFASSSHEPCKTGSPLNAYPPPHPPGKWLSPTLFPPDECKHLQTSLKVST